MQDIKDINMNENLLHVYQGVKILPGLHGSKNSEKDYEFNSDFENY